MKVKAEEVDTFGESEVRFLSGCGELAGKSGVRFLSGCGEFYLHPKCGMLRP